MDYQRFFKPIKSKVVEGIPARLMSVEAKKSVTSCLTNGHLKFARFSISPLLLWLNKAFSRETEYAIRSGVADYP